MDAQQGRWLTTDRVGPAARCDATWINTPQSSCHGIQKAASSEESCGSEHSAAASECAAHATPPLALAISPTLVALHRALQRLAAVVAELLAHVPAPAGVRSHADRGDAPSALGAVLLLSVHLGGAKLRSIQRAITTVLRGTLVVL